MTLSIAKAILRLWKAAKKMPGTGKVAKMKSLSALSSKYNGPAAAVARAKKVLSRDTGLKELGKTMKRITKKK